MTKNKPQNTQETAVKATFREWLGLGVLALACILYVMDLTVLHLAVPSLSKELQPTSTQLLWIIDIYGFMVAGFLITMGTLGDRIGRRKLLLIGAAAFGGVSLLAAFSRSAEMLIVSRALLGIAGATLAPSTLSLIFSMFKDPHERSRAVAIWISSFSAGSAIGPILGGILLQYFWWGSVFLLALPVMLLLFILGPLVLPEYKDPKAGKLDFISVGLSLFAILGVIYGIKEIAQHGFTIVALLSITSGLFIGYLFVKRQLMLNDPMLDLKLFKISSFRAALMVNLMAVFVAFGYFLFVAQYFQLVLNMTPLHAGLLSLPSAISFILGSNIAPRLFGHIHPSKVITGCLIVAALGLLLLTQIGSLGLIAVVLASIIISLGMAPVFGLTTELIVGSAPPEKAGAASGIAETAAELGGALGISILGSIGVAIYRSRISATLPGNIPPLAEEHIKDTLGGAMQISSQLPSELGHTVRDVAQTAFVEGIVAIAVLSTVLAVIAAFIAMRVLRNIKVENTNPHK